MANTNNAFIVSKDGSPLSNLTSGNSVGDIKYMVHGTDAPVGVSAMTAATNHKITGVVFPLYDGSQAAIKTFLGTDLTHTAYNIIGDPAVADYSLTSGDLIDDDGKEKDGGAQKFVNAVLDGAYRAYTSGVAQGSGINSMTVSRGDLSLSSTVVTDGTGIVNTYTRSYTVNFKYFQSGAVTDPDGGAASRPDIADDNSDGAPF